MCSEDKAKVDIYTDGGCSGNPGKGACAAVLIFIDSKGHQHEKIISCAYQLTTNNRMEIMAAIIAFEALKKDADITLYSDSQYLVNAINNHWIDNWEKANWKTSTKKDVKNSDLWKRLLKSMEPHKCSFVWVKGHNDNFYNEKCDEVLKKAYEGDNLLIDENYMKYLDNENDDKNIVQTSLFH